MAVTNSKVLFCYVPTGQTKPSPADGNTIYFMEQAKEIHVGDVVIARNISGEIPTIIVNGDANGNYVSNAVWDASTNTLTLTKATLPTYTIAKQQSAETGYSATYALLKDNVVTGDKINIPKDMVIESGELKYVETPDVPYEGAQVGDPYIDFVIANSGNQHLYVPVKDLVDTYTAGTHIVISNNVISHDIQGTDVSTDLGTDLPVPASGQTGAIHVSGQVEYDALGHVISVADKNIYSAVKAVADNAAGVVDDRIDALDLSEVGGSGEYLTTISQVNGQVAATAQTADTTVTNQSTNLVTSGAVYTAVISAMPTWNVVTTPEP